MSLELLLSDVNLLLSQIPNLSLSLRPPHQRLELDTRMPLHIFDQIDLTSLMRPIGRLEPDQRPPRVLPFSFFARDRILPCFLFRLLPPDHRRDAQGLLELAASSRFCSRQ